MLAAAILQAAAAINLPWARPPPPQKARIAVLGGGFAGLTAARTLAADKHCEVRLFDQRDYFEYTPGILRAWVEPGVHKRLVNPIRRLLRGGRASFERVPPGHGAALEAGAERPLRLTVALGTEPPVVSYECDYAVLAAGGELAPITDDRQAPTIVARRARLNAQVDSLMGNASTALVVGVFRSSFCLVRGIPQ